MLQAFIILVSISNPYLCTEAEIAHYERHGWDAYECHADKAALDDTDPHKYDADTCGETDEGCAEDE